MCLFRGANRRPGKDTSARVPIGMGCSGEGNGLLCGFYMSVLHLNIAAFAVQLEILENPRLAGRPVAVALAERGRAPLICVSSQAHAAGLAKGMTVAEARGRERGLIVVPPNPRLYRREQAKLLELAEAFTPVYEPSRLGSIFLDMSGTERLFGTALDAASKIRARVLRELRLTPTLGVARNKLVSRIAAKLVRPQGLCDVFPGNEAPFLKPLDLDLLPGVGSVASGRFLAELGIRRIGELATVPRAILVQLFGKQGTLLHDKANGIDLSEVRLPERAPALEVEQSFLPPSNDDEVLLAALWGLLEGLGFKLRERGEVAGILELKGIYADRREVALHISLRPSLSNELKLFRLAKAQWRKFYARRIALKSLAVRLSRLMRAFEQIDWTDDRRDTRLLATLDSLRKKHGEKIVGWGLPHQYS